MCVLPKIRPTNIQGKLREDDNSLHPFSFLSFIFYCNYGAGRGTVSVGGVRGSEADARRTQDEEAGGGGGGGKRPTRAHGATGGRNAPAVVVVIGVVQARVGQKLVKRNI